MAILGTILAGEAAVAQAIAPENGYLVIHGGGASSEPLDKFIELAGGAVANIIVIPTAAGFDDYGEKFQQEYFRPFRAHGVTKIQILHATSREVADSDAFIAPIRTATGLWFSGGRQWRLADAYLDTKTERALWDLLGRGGVIGGGSAGATIQGSYLVRGDTRGALAPVGDHERGFGFLKNSAIDQHFLNRNRQFDLLEVIRTHPQFLGIGIDADAGIVVHGDEFRVIGAGYVAIYDPKLVTANGHFYFLENGQRFYFPTSTPKSANGNPLWLPQILPPVKLTRSELDAITGTYLAGERRVTVAVAGERVVAQLCPGDERELIPISGDTLYDKLDGSKIRLQRDHSGVISGLTWNVEKLLNQRMCIEGFVEAIKEKR